MLRWSDAGTITPHYNDILDTLAIIVSYRLGGIWSILAILYWDLELPMQVMSTIFIYSMVQWVILII